jgi:hypothetical protein
MENKTLTIGALALSVGFASLAQASDIEPDHRPTVPVACDDDHGGDNLAGCSGECNGECGSGGGGDD